MRSSHNFIDLTGQVFTNLTVLERAGTKRRAVTWRCRCTCGVETIVRGDLLRTGIQKSCAKNGHRWLPTKGKGYTAVHVSEYSTWKHMRQRCEEKGHQAYPEYGGRGIFVCERWKSFLNFLEDMGPKPTPQHTIDRIHNDMGYEPRNCRWATDAEQRRNKRNNVYVAYKGKRTLLMDVATEVGLSLPVLYNRLKLGWSLADAISTPVRKNRGWQRRKKKPLSKNKPPSPNPPQPETSDGQKI